MRAFLVHIAPLFHLARLTSALAVVGNAWFVVLWSRADSNQALFGSGATGLSGPVGPPLIAATALAFGLYAFGAALNDVLDVRRDRVLGADRPLATGRVSLEAAVWIVFSTCALAILGACWFGQNAVLLTLAIQLAILVYHAAARFVPAMGLVIIGAIHAAHMLVPNTQLAFLWPVWLILTHAIAVALAVHVVGLKTPRLSRRAFAAVAIGWIALSAFVLVAPWRPAPEPWAISGRQFWPKHVPATAAIAAIVIAALFAVWATRIVRRFGPGSRSAEKIGRYGSIWMPLYGTAIFAGAGRLVEATALGGLALVASFGVALAREIVGLLSEPVGYRR